MTVEEPTKRRAILIFVLNRPGVLNKISMLIRRKMYNVETVTACRTHRPGISRMTLTLFEDSDDKMKQVVKQIEKVAEVLSAKELDVDGSFWREVAIIKLEAGEALVEDLGRRFNFQILERCNHELFIVQIAGTSKYVEDFMQAAGEDKIIETARSGFTAMEK
jgi:acetolactate synthase I/III small subunit